MSEPGVCFLSAAPSVADEDPTPWNVQPSARRSALLGCGAAGGGIMRGRRGHGQAQAQTLATRTEARTGGSRGRGSAPAARRAGSCAGPTSLITSIGPPGEARCQVPLYLVICKSVSHSHYHFVNMLSYLFGDTGYGPYPQRSLACLTQHSVPPSRAARAKSRGFRRRHHVARSRRRRSMLSSGRSGTRSQLQPQYQPSSGRPRSRGRRPAALAPSRCTGRQGRPRRRGGRLHRSSTRPLPGRAPSSASSTRGRHARR